MAKPFPVPWTAESHTLVKHQVYSRYLAKWLPIMMQGFNGDVTYAEGFAGPGIYEGGEPGSPVIAVKTLVGNPRLRASGKRIRFLFVDADKRCAELLAKNLEQAVHPVRLDELAKYGIDLEICHGDYDPNLAQLLTTHGAWGRPMLVVLDSWGGGVHLDLVRKIASNNAGEVFITFEPQHFARFAGAEGVAHGDTVFGDPEWRRVQDEDPTRKRAWVVAKYRDALRTAGFGHVLTFELVNDRGNSLVLVFGTNHKRGLEKMKEAMWEVDSLTGVRYRDPADPNQELLDVKLEPDLGPLCSELSQQLRVADGEWVLVRQLRAYALFETVYKESQVVPALEVLHSRGVVVGDGVDGAIRIGGSAKLRK